MPVRAVIFDFGGVLCFHPGEQQIERVSRACGLPVAEFLRAFWEQRLEYDAGRLDSRAYWHGVAAAAGVAIDDSHLPALVRLEVELWNRLDPRVMDWVRQLRAAGLGTAILSNLPRPLGEELRSLPGFLQQFDQVSFSYELGLVKPERAIYEHAAAGLGVAPGDSLFLDDRPRNVAGALEAGMHAQQYSTWEEFLASDAISRLGLPPPEGYSAVPGAE
jgi:putative hydrolase of the HAD superfamily